MKVDSEKGKKWIMIALLIIIFAAIFMYYGHYKAYLYEDEVLSYTAANSRDGMRPSLPINRIADGGEFVRKAVAVEPEARFDFSNAVKNTSEDPHPPLYLLLLHFVSSLFPGVFSKWYGLSINLIFGAATVIFLFFAGEELFKGEIFDGEGGPAVPASVVAFIYVISLGFMNQLMNLRMYVLLQAFTTLLTLQYLKLLNKEDGKTSGNALFGKKESLFLILNLLLGVMSHYYFLIFAFYEAAIFTVILLIRKDFRSAIFHVASCFLAGLLTLLIFPPIIWQLTSSDVGEESFGSRNLLEIARRIRAMTSFVSSEIYGGQLILFLAVLILLLVLSFKKGELMPLSKLFNLRISFLILTAIGYFLTVSFTTPYLTSRYLSPDYPLVMLITVYLILPGISFLFKDVKAGLIFFMLMMAVPMYLQVREGLYDENKAVMRDLSESHSDEICVFFRGISAEENYFELENYERLLAMRLEPKEGEDTGDTEKIRDEKEIVVYVPSGKTVEECLARIQEIDPGFEKTQRLYKAYYSEAWVFMKE